MLLSFTNKTGSDSTGSGFLNNSATTLDSDVHEIVITVTITAKLGEETAYLCEIKQAGIFTINLRTVSGCQIDHTGIVAVPAAE